MKQKLINALLFVTSIIFCLITLELGLRAYHAEWGLTNFRFPDRRHDYPIDFDAELGWVPKQDVQGIDPHTWLSPATILQDGTRSNGSGDLRDEREPILAIGDSLTFGMAVSDWETWPAQLEKLSGRRVINGGESGYGIDQEFLQARRLLNRYQISTVIFSFIPDDIRRCAMSVEWGLAKPYFELMNGRLTLENVPVAPAPPAPKESGPLFVLGYSRLAHAVMKRLFPEWWLTPQKTYEKPMYDDANATKVACALLHELEGLIEAHSSRLIILVQHREEESFSESASAESVLTCLSDPATRVLDLGSTLSRLKAQDPSIYKQLWQSDGGHMSAAGNIFVALEIMKVLTRPDVRAVPLSPR
jgi:hypothetical protein